MIKKIGMSNGIINKIKIEFDLDLIATLSILTEQDIKPITTKLNGESVISGFILPIYIEENIFDKYKNELENEIIKFYKDLISKLFGNETNNNINIEERIDDKFIDDKFITELLDKINNSENGHVRIQIDENKLMKNLYKNPAIIWSGFNYMLFNSGIMVTSTYQFEDPETERKMKIISIRMKEPGDKLS